MPQTEIVEQMAKNSPLTNLILLAEEIQPYTANAVVDAFYYGDLSWYDAMGILNAIVF